MNTEMKWADLLKTLEATEKEFDSSQELTTNDDGDDELCKV